MHSRTRFALAPVALGLAALLAHTTAGAQGYNPNVPPGYVEQGQGGAPGGPDVVQAADPSSRIATVTDVAGGLSFAPAGSDEWAAIGLNRPVTTGDRVWVDPGGRAELHAGSTAIRLGGASAASVLNLDDRTTQVKLTQGTLQLRVRALPPDQQVEIDTPNLAFVPREPGDYRLDVSPDGATTLVSVRHGTAVLYGDTRSIEMSRGQRMRFAGPDLADAGPGNYAGPDSFDKWTAARDAREDESVSARYVPRDMTGYTALDDYGDWQQDPGYGAVWFPRDEPTGWAPYSTGYWAWVAPWGWTWIDDAPWGFAPSHYGRWAYFGNRWGWVPGPVAVQPYYAPAVVGFIGGVSATISIGGGPGVAWYPLGPRDPYRPIYHASPTYITRINNVTINNNFIVRGDRDRVRWSNREVPGAISGMPSRSFVEGRPVPRAHSRDEWRHLPAGEGNFGAPPMAPVKTSLIGAAQPRGLPPMARAGFERQAIAARPPAHLGPDVLANRLARQGGTAGAGPAWRGPVQQEARPQAGSHRGPQPGQAMPWQPDVRVSQAAQSGRGPAPRPDQMRGLPQEAQRQEQAIQRQQFDQQRQMEERQRQTADFQQRQQQALQRQQIDQQRQQQQVDQQRQAQQRQPQVDQQRQAQERQQVEQQRQAQERQQMEQQRQTQQRQPQVDQQRQAQERQQVEQQRQAQERQQMEQQRQVQQRQQQVDQQRQAQERQQQVEQQRQAQERQQMEQQRQAQQRQQQLEQQRQAQERQQMEQQRQQQQVERARQFQEQQRQQMEQQRQQAVQRQAQEQQRQVQEQQRQVQEQQRQIQEQQRQQQERQHQIQQQQQQQQQQQHVQQDRARQSHEQARNDDHR